MSDFATGYIERDFASQPVGSAFAGEKDWDLPTMSMQEAAELCEEQAAHNADPLGNCIRHNVMPTYQNGHPYCWAHAGVMAMKIAYARATGTSPVFSSTHPGCLIMNYRSRGGNAFDIMPFLAEHGCTTVDYWPENDKSRSNDTPDMREHAKQYRLIEGYSLGRDPAQKWTAIAMGFGVWSGYSDMRHAMCSARFGVDSRGNPYCLDINSWNRNAPTASSWSDSWMDDNRTIYKRSGRKFMGFEQYAFRVSTIL